MHVLHLALASICQKTLVKQQYTCTYGSMCMPVHNCTPPRASLALGPGPNLVHLLCGTWTKFCILLCLCAALCCAVLLQTADDSRIRTLQASSYLPAGIIGKGVYGGAMPSVTVTADPGSGNNKTPDSSSHTTSSTSSSQQQQQQLAGMLSEADALPLQQMTNQAVAATTAAAAANEHDMYSEVHDSCGSRVFVGTHNTSGAVPAKPESAAASGAAAKKHPPARRNNSFRRASHHPPGEALPRVQTGNSSSTAGGAAAMAEQLENAADANAHLFAHWRNTGSSTGGSMCSMVTEGTWGTQVTAADGRIKVATAAAVSKLHPRTLHHKMLQTAGNTPQTSLWDCDT